MIIKKLLNPFHKIYKKCKKIIVRFFSTKKCVCEHYAVK